jgi:hypothetical protein
MRWLCWILCVAALGYTLASEAIVTAGDPLPGVVLTGLCLLTTLALYCMARGFDARNFGRALSARPRMQSLFAGALRVGFFILGLFAALMFPASVLMAVSLIAMYYQVGISAPPLPWKVFGFFYFAHFVIMPVVSGLAAFCPVWFAIKGRTARSQKATVPAPA